MNSKIELIDEYIHQCETTESDKFECLIETIVTLFKKDISDIAQGLEYYDQFHLKARLGLEREPVETDYTYDIKLLKQKLEYYKATLEYELEKTKDSNIPLISVSQNQTNQISVNISLEQTITVIEAIPDDKLSQDEKEQLEGKLSKLNTEKDKSKLWEKTQSALKWIADKGVEVGIAALPYIVEALKNVK